MGIDVVNEIIKIESYCFKLSEHDRLKLEIFINFFFSYCQRKKTQLLVFIDITFKQLK